MNTPLAEHKTFLGSPAAAKFTGYSLRHFQRHAESRGIFPVPIGRKLYWKVSDLERLKRKRAA